MVTASCNLRNCSTRRQHSGSAATEFLLAAIPVLLVGLGSIELAQWFYVKQAISLALLEAGRAGITAHASPAAMETAFERALHPLFPPTRQLSSEARLQAALHSRTAKIGSAPWQIRVRNPSGKVFDDFSRSHLKIGNAPQLQVIDNTYQAEQDAAYRQSGWQDGVGPASGLTIYQANTLVLEVNYLYEPIVPGVGDLLKILAPNNGSYRSRGMAAGYLPIQQEIKLTMQSHPASWSSLSNEKVLVDGASGSLAGQHLAIECRGLWCTTLNPDSQGANTSLANGQTSRPLTATPSNSTLPEWQPGAGTPTYRATPEIEPYPDTILTTLQPGLDDPACGISLCCLT